MTVFITKNQFEQNPHNQRTGNTEPRVGHKNADYSVGKQNKHTTYA